MNWQTGQSAAAQAFPIFPANLANLEPHMYAPPEVAMYSVGLQRELAPSVMWVLQYVGNSARHQWDDRRSTISP